MNAKFFPIVLMVIYFIAAMVYFYNRDYRRGIYWLAALVLNATITF